MNGTITLTDTAIAAVLGLAAHEVPGVVGMSSAGLRDSISNILGKSEAYEGIAVKSDASKTNYDVEVYVVLAYGTRIPTVVDNIVQRVIWAGKSLAGINVLSVKVHVVGISRP